MEIMIETRQHPIFKDYCADKDGNIYSTKFGKWRQIARAPHGRGYNQFSAQQSGYMKSYLWHRFVWECWNGMIPKGMQINHIDCDKTNNKLENLEVVDQWENMRKGKEAGILYGSANPNHPFYWR